jgi:hypothetical protein
MFVYCIFRFRRKRPLVAYRRGKYRIHSRFMNSDINDSIDISDLQMGVLEDRIIIIYELGRNGRGG